MPLSEVLPLHYDTMFAGLAEIRKDSTALEADGKGRPKVLLIGYLNAAVASMFYAAGLTRKI